MELLIETLNLADVLGIFNRRKEGIRSLAMSEIETTPGYNGLRMAIEYSKLMECVVKELFNLTSKLIGDTGEIAAFLYGSPGRREMVCESDLDLMLVYRDRSKKFIEFKNKFKEIAKPFEFCKVDLPEWGTLEEAKTYASSSITEGNQVLESRFVCGDDNIRKEIKSIQKEFGMPERMRRNIVFQKFYFEQYYKQRVRNGSINVKYCDGGSRDYLFIYWFNQLMSGKYPDWDKAPVERPMAEQGLSNLFHNSLITFPEFSKAIDALQFNLLLRNEILLANKGSKDEGLTYLDSRTLQAVYDRMPKFMKRYGIRSPEELAKHFESQRFYICDIKKRIWNLMIAEKGMELEDDNWGNDFQRSYSLLTDERERGQLSDSDDLLIRIATIWGCSNSNQKKLFDQLCIKEKDSKSWEIQASITTSPLCSQSYLHHIATGIGKEIGYGYILRIISRNPNVEEKTLRSIAEDTTLESRYTQCAIAALEYGKEAANHQI
jgi:hypothetical protein